MKNISLCICIVIFFSISLYGSQNEIESVFPLNIGNPILIKPSNNVLEGIKLEIPELGKIDDKTICLKFKAFLKHNRSGGWNPYLGIKINDTYLNEKTADDAIRLLNKGEGLVTKEKMSSWWGTRADIPCLIVFFTDGKQINSQVISPKQEEFEYILDISDFSEIATTKGKADEKINSIEFISTFTEDINSKWCKSEVEGLLIQDAQIVYLDKQQMLEYRKPFAKVTPANKTFLLTDINDLKITHRGNILIAKDELEGNTNLGNVRIIGPQRLDKATVFNLIKQDDSIVNYRKEIAFYDDGVLELTIKAQYESYAKTRKGYSFYVPISTLEGATYQALTSFSGKNIASGVITQEMKDGNLTFYPEVRYISFKRDDIKLVFDLAPGGNLNYPRLYFLGEVTPWGKVSKAGDYIKFTFFDVSNPLDIYGTLNISKVLIYEGEFDYGSKHPVYGWGYGDGIQPKKFFVFGTEKTDENMISAGINIYDKQRKYGWKEDAVSLCLDKNEKSDIFKNSVFVNGNFANTFLCDIQPGLYVVTVSTGHQHHNIGPFSIII